MPASRLRAIQRIGEPADRGGEDGASASHGACAGVRRRRSHPLDKFAEKAGIDPGPGALTDEDVVANPAVLASTHNPLAGFAVLP